MNRLCGGCNACCVIPAVHGDGVEKLAYVPCKHSRGDVLGRWCQIYDSRPLMCRGFECVWVMGYGGEWDRPDLSGVMGSVNEIDGSVVVRVYELSVGAVEGSGRGIMWSVENLGLPIHLSRYRT